MQQAQQAWCRWTSGHTCPGLWGRTGPRDAAHLASRLQVPRARMSGVGSAQVTSTWRIVGDRRKTLAAKIPLRSRASEQRPNRASRSGWTPHLFLPRPRPAGPTLQSRALESGGGATFARFPCSPVAGWGVLPALERAPGRFLLAPPTGGRVWPLRPPPGRPHRTSAGRRFRSDPPARAPWFRLGTGTFAERERESKEEEGPGRGVRSSCLEESRLERADLEGPRFWGAGVSLAKAGNRCTIPRASHDADACGDDAGHGAGALRAAA